MNIPIVLYSSDYCPFSHRCRIVFCEKEMQPEIRSVDLHKKPEELVIYNPYNQVPVLVDREVHIYESNIINEYLDDRFPHPQLIPVDIVLRARARLMQHALENDIFRSVQILEKRPNKERAEVCRKRIREGLLLLMAQLTKSNRYIIDREFTMLDVSLAPLLWRLEHYKISLPRKAVPLIKYAERVFSRPSFINSLSTIEKVMRK